MPSVEHVDFEVVEVILVEFGAFRWKDEVVLAPED
jgi:hypothetical protein